MARQSASRGKGSGIGTAKRAEQSDVLDSQSENARELARLPKEKLFCYIGRMNGLSGKVTLADKAAGGAILKAVVSNQGGLTPRARLPAALEEIGDR